MSVVYFASKDLREKQKMKLFRSTNIFESFKFQLICNKFSGYLFFTVSEQSKKFSSKMTAWDVFILFTSLVFASASCVTVLKSPLVMSSRSIIIGIADFFFSKFVVLHPIITIMLNFYFRHEWFHILNILHRIDRKVKLILCLKLDN